MRAETFETSSTRQQVEVRLDGLPIQVPSERCSLVAIRSYVETLAMEHQRIVCAFSVDGERASLAQPLTNRKTFRRVDAKTIELDQMPLQFLEAALHATPSLPVSVPVPTREARPFVPRVTSYSRSHTRPLVAMSGRQALTQ